MTIVTLKKLGHTYSQIVTAMSNEFNCTVARSTVRRTLKRYRETGRVADRPRSGRRRSCTAREERAVRRIALSSRWLSLRKVAGEATNRLGHHISASSALRILKRYHLRRRIAARVPFLTKRQKRARLDWAKRYVRWPIVNWLRVVFSDEKIFRITSNRHGLFVTRMNHEKFRENCISRSPKSGPQVHIWGAMGCRGLTPLKRIHGTLNAAEYQGQILHDVNSFGDFCVGPKKPWTFMQDLAPAHNAQSTRHFLAQKNIKVLDWPGNSPDANPIENLWAYVVRRLPLSLPKNSDELMVRVQKVWTTIPVDYLQTLISSMNRRLRAIIAAGGGHTRY